MIPENFVPNFEAVAQGYESGAFTPRELVTHLISKADAYLDRNIWITRFALEDIEPFLARLEAASDSPKNLPLYGIPFAVKDNFDIEGFPTTAACPDFAYEAKSNAFAVQQLLDAGAIPLGKTNMDQFATGLVGTRSPEPWGPCHNALNPDYISGGSSSGSAVAVSLGLVSFSLGTDTAGSGRVPAMLNNIYGLKPSRGLFSMSGVVPACRSLDCPSVFSLSVADAEKVFSVAAKHDAEDAYSRVNPFSNSSRYFGKAEEKPLIGVPLESQLEFFGEPDAESLFKEATESWKSLGAKIVEIDFEPFFTAAKLLYEGPWVAERYAAIEDLMKSNPDAVHPVVRGIVQSAEGKNAVDAFKSEYQMQEYRALATAVLETVDFLLTPTAPRAYLLSELLENPVQLNSNMGHYTNYMNLLDLSGLAIPAGFMSNGMPFGVTMIAPKFKESQLMSHALAWENSQELPMGASQQLYKPQVEQALVSHTDHIEVAVCGAHLSGMPLNWQLLERGAVLSESTKSSENYKLYALDTAPPLRPGMVRNETEGVAIEVEVWSVPEAEFGSFVAGIPFPLGIGKLELMDGRWVTGFICEASGLAGAEDISSLGSWRRYIG